MGFWFSDSDDNKRQRAGCVNVKGLQWLQMKLLLASWRRQIHDGALIYDEAIWWSVTVWSWFYLKPVEFRFYLLHLRWRTASQTARRDSPWCSASASPSSRWPASHTPASGCTGTKAETQTLRSWRVFRSGRFLWDEATGEEAWRCIASIILPLL